MRFSAWLVLLFHGLAFVLAADVDSSSSTSSTTTTNSTSPVLTAPVCGLLCITKLSVTSECGLNTTCVCYNEPLKAEIQTCILSKCTIREALESQKYSYEICGVVPQDRRPLVWHLGIAFLITGLAAYGLRILERLRSHTWGWDDWVITLVTIILIPMGALTVPLSQSGLGMDMWNVSPEDVNQVLYYFYWEEILYAVALALNKISILFFYLRVFPAKPFRRVVYIMIGLNVCYALAFGLAVIFQCHPLDGAWQSWDGEYKAKCVNINYLGWSGAGVNILFDIVTLILPLPALAKLTTSWRKRLQILAMFAVGFFVTLVSILRLRSMIEFGSTTNVTQDYVEVGYWSTIEISIGIVCACMPAVRALLSHLFPLVFGGTRNGSNGAKSPYPYRSTERGGGYNKREAYNSALSSGNNSDETKKSKIHRYTKYGHTAEITVHNEWTVLENTANRSDVELVALEKKLPFSTDAGFVAEATPDTDQWSAESGRVSLPIQGRNRTSL